MWGWDELADWDWYILYIHTLLILLICVKYWVNQKVHLDFSKKYKERHKQTFWATKQITNENLLYSSGNSVPCRDLNGKEIQKRGDIYIYIYIYMCVCVCIADSLYSRNLPNTVKQLYSNKNWFKKRNTMFKDGVNTTAWRKRSSGGGASPAAFTRQVTTM